MFVEKVLLNDGSHSHGGPDAHYDSDAHGHSHGAALVAAFEYDEVDGGEDADTASPAAARPLTARAVLMPYMMAMLLSMHSFIEGIALGVEETVVETLDVVMAIAAHKWFAAFALGVNLTRSRLDRTTLIHIVIIFSLMTPLGILIGILVTSSLESVTQSLASEAVKAVASGTFVYVGLIEVIVPELDGPFDRKPKFGLVLFGATAMSYLAIWT